MYPPDSASSICQVLCYAGSTWIFSASRDKTVLMWDLNQGDEPIQEFCGHELVVNGLAISPGTHTRTHTLRCTLFKSFKKPFHCLMSILYVLCSIQNITYHE